MVMPMKIKLRIKLTLCLFLCFPVLLAAEEISNRVLLERMDQRFAQMDQRFEQVDQRFEDMQRQLDQRFEAMQIQLDKRLEALQVQLDKRFGQTSQQIAGVQSTLEIMAGIFAVIMSTMLGLLFWDRLTIVRKAKQESLSALESILEQSKTVQMEQTVEEAVRRIEKEGRLRDLILALRQRAASDPPLAADLRAFHLL
jgi:predicted PurR-regulated permease PerM